MAYADEYRQFLLSSIPSARLASGGRMILCRCFYCPDSADPRSAHFYISIPSSDSEPSLCYCHKCKTGGIVTNKTLLHWGIYDDSVGLWVLNHNKKITNSSFGRKYSTDIIYRVMNVYITPDDISKYKLDYINKRLGISLTFKDILEKKIVLNLKDVLKSNHISNYTRNGSIINQLDRNFLGFISFDNAFINMRKIDSLVDSQLYESINKRYVNYSIFDKRDNTQRFYTMPGQLDLTEPRRIQLHIAEGPFDILSVFYNLRKDDKQIYTSVGGSAFKGLIKYFINILRLVYIEIHIYPDNDKYGSREIMNDIAQFVQPFNIPVIIHRNLCPNQKDFGVDINKIDEKIERIL